MADNTVKHDKVEDTYRVTDEEARRADEKRAADEQRAAEENLVDRELNKTNPDANPDPMTGAPGSHPVGTGIGAAAAGTAGVAIGTAIAPGPGSVIGGAIGAVVGAVAGGYAGKGIAEAVNPTEEAAYWREEYQARSYYDPATPYSEYEPAYRYGVEARCRYGEECPPFEQVEADLGRDWDSQRGSSTLDWDRAKLAARDAWERTNSRVQSPRGKNP